MDIAHIERLVEEAYERHANAVIADLKALGRECMHSGDDSPYQNVWQEFATQIQEGESVFWNLYEDLARGRCRHRVELMSATERQLLWFFTEPGQDWTFDIDYDKEHDIERDPDENEPASFDEEDVANELYQRVYNAADNEELPVAEQSEDEENDDDITEDHEDTGPSPAEASQQSPKTLELSLFA